MTNDNGLVDEFENLDRQKREIEQKEEELKKRIIELAKQKNTEVLFGSHKKCSVKRYERIVYPQDKSEIINLLKQKGLWDEFSIINYSRFGSRAVKGELDQELLRLIKKEEAFRLAFKEIWE